MTTRRATDEADIRRRLEEWAEALRAMDLDAVASSYAPDIVSFDVGPAQRQVGAAAKRMNWEQLFAMFQHPLSYEIRDLTIHVSDDLAFGYSLNRVSGTLKDGTMRELPWVRFTACFRKIEGKWLIVNDHVSLPVDPTSGRALMQLEP